MFRCLTYSSFFSIPMFFFVCVQNNVWLKKIKENTRTKMSYAILLFNDIPPLLSQAKAKEQQQHNKEHENLIKY